MMTCKETGRYFDDAADGSLEETKKQDFHAHLKQCKLCSKAFMSYRKSVERLHSAPLLEPGKDVFALIMAKLNAQTAFPAPRERAAKLFFSFRKLSYAAAFCAAVLLVIMAGRTLHMEKIEKETQVVAFLVQQHSMKWELESVNISVPGYGELLGEDIAQDQPPWEKVFTVLGI